MAEQMNQENHLITISKEDLLENVMIMKKQDRRLSQMCAAYVNEKYELSYSFADDESFDYTTLRMIIELNEKVPSISDFYPYASFYENEMRELHGVDIEMIGMDYHGKLYRIKKENPLLSEEGKALRALKIAAEKAAEQETVHPVPEQTDREGGNA